VRGSFCHYLITNARFPSRLPLLPDTLPSPHIDTTDVSSGQAVALVERFIQV
jgi:hypothetical protein